MLLLENHPEKLSYTQGDLDIQVSIDSTFITINIQHHSKTVCRLMSCCNTHDIKIQDILTDVEKGKGWGTLGVNIFIQVIKNISD